jgi:hypothetical protein
LLWWYVVDRPELHEAIDVTTEPDFTGGGYRYKDLLDAGIVSSRGDLNYKQTRLGFPRPIKIGLSAAWYPKAKFTPGLPSARRCAIARQTPKVKSAPRSGGRAAHQAPRDAMGQDRAEVLVTALWQIAARAIRDRLGGGSTAALRAAKAHAVEYVRGELADIERQARADRHLAD